VRGNLFLEWKRIILLGSSQAMHARPSHKDTIGEDVSVISCKSLKHEA
jgi:hypothetical protein